MGSDHYMHMYKLTHDPIKTHFHIQVIGINKKKKLAQKNVTLQYMHWGGGGSR